MTDPRSRRGSILRRYPALALVIAAGALAILLPSALTVPQSGPTALAEFAPVPGSGDGRSDVSDLGQAASGGLGFGSGGGNSSGTFAESAKGPEQKRARLKKCVGNPPRQTEDLLSPPCVAFFDGDNFGSTWKGVTKDEVTAVLYGRPEPRDSSAFFTDCSAQPDPATDRAEDSICQAYSRFFNDRYQTYGRRVHLWVYHQWNNVPPPPPALTVADLDDKKKPFALVPASLNLEGYVHESGKRKIVTAFYESMQSSFYRASAPYLFGFRAQGEDQARIFASYICKKLADRPARHAGDPTYRNTKRKFGIFSSSGDPNNLNKFLPEQLEQQCGIKNLMKGNSSNPGPSDSVQMKTANVTTALLIGGGSIPPAGLQGATDAGWLPEWVIQSGYSYEGPDSAEIARTYDPIQWRSAFGISMDYRRDLYRNQSWYAAYKEACSGCPEPSSKYTPYIYDALKMLFHGIQAAGPRLTPENLDKGLHAIPQIGSTNPYKPAAYFAPGGYSYLKDAMEIWWDPQGQTEPTAPIGCFRLPRGGQRFRSGEWIGDDGDVFNDPSHPCQAPASP